MQQCVIGHEAIDLPAQTEEKPVEAEEESRRVARFRLEKEEHRPKGLRKKYKV